MAPESVLSLAGCSWLQGRFLSPGADVLGAFTRLYCPDAGVILNSLTSRVLQHRHLPFLLAEPLGFNQYQSHPSPFQAPRVRNTCLALGMQASFEIP